MHRIIFISAFLFLQTPIFAKPIGGAYLKPKDAPVCTNKPSEDDIKNGQWVYTDHMYTVDEAEKLGIPVMHVSGSYSSKLFVRDYSRSKTCLCTDGVTKIKYGQVIRSVIEIENYDASIGIDLATIAASGTLGKTKQYFFLYKDGFYNPKIDETISSVSGKVFDVENYYQYQMVMNKLIALLGDNNTVFSVNEIGIERPLKNDGDLFSAPVMTYTLSCIADGKCGDDILKEFQNSSNAQEAIRSTFQCLDATCDNTKPNEVLRAKAKQYIQDYRIRKK